jgi:hypothetical protein
MVARRAYSQANFLPFAACHPVSNNHLLVTGHCPVMRTLLDPYWLTLAVTSAVQLVFFLRWLYRRVRNDEIMRAFVHDMATNHLPHIYERLDKLCEQQGIERSQLPPIRWVDLNDRSC